AFARTSTLPGGRQCPAAAMTGMSIAAPYRRRGGLTALVRAQLEETYRQGEQPISILLASESGIYRRFGYGTATRQARIRVPGQAAFRPGLDTDGLVDEVDCAPDDPACSCPIRRCPPNGPDGCSATTGTGRRSSAPTPPAPAPGSPCTRRATRYTGSPPRSTTSARPARSRWRSWSRPPPRPTG